MAAARLRMWPRVLLEEADALIDVLRVPVDGRHRDAGEVVREEAAGSVVVAVGGAVAAASYSIFLHLAFAPAPQVNANAFFT